MATAVVQLAVFKWQGWPVSRQMWVVIWVALISGALTLLFQNKTFIQWKPTIVYWVMAGAIVGSRYVGTGDHIQKALGGMLVLPDRAWAHLAWGWGVAMLAPAAPTSRWRTASASRPGSPTSSFPPSRSPWSSRWAASLTWPRAGSCPTRKP